MGPQLSKGVETKDFFKLWRKKIPKIPNIFILFHSPQATYHNRTGIFIALLIISPLLFTEKLGMGKEIPNIFHILSLAMITCNYNRQKILHPRFK